MGTIVIDTPAGWNHRKNDGRNIMEISRFSIIGDAQGIDINVTLDNGQVLHKSYNGSVEATDDNTVSVETLKSYIINHDNQVKFGNDPEPLRIGFNYQDNYGNVSRKEVTVKNNTGNGFLSLNKDNAYRTFRYDGIRGGVTIID